MAIVQELPGQELKLYLAARHKADLAGGGAVKLTNAYLARFGIPRSTKSDVLRRLEAKGYISVGKGPGRACLVTVLKR